MWSLAGVVTLLIAWQIGAWYMFRVNPLGERIFPSWRLILTDSVRGFAILAPLGSPNVGYAAALKVLLFHSLETGRRLIVGTGLGIVSGIGMGLILGYVPFLNNVLGPVLNGIRAIPKLALTPLFVFWFAGVDLGVYVFVALSVFLILVISTYHAAQNVSFVMQRFASTMGATRSQILRTVIVPGMVPELFASVRIVCALSWSITLGGEYTGAQSGLGFLMRLAQQFGFFGRIMVIVLLFTIYASVIDFLLMRLRSRIWWGRA